MNDPRELFMHELGDILTAERTIAKMLPKLGREAQDEKLVSRIEEHLEETRGQIANVEEAFRKLGEKPKAEPCPAIEGLKTEHDENARKVGSELMDLFVAGSAVRTEHYEIAVYTGLVAQAKAMGEREVATLLEENLEQEELMLRDAESISESLAKAWAKA